MNTHEADRTVSVQELASMGVKGISERELALLRTLLNKIHDNMVAALQPELGDDIEG